VVYAFQLPQVAAGSNVTHLGINGFSNLNNAQALVAIYEDASGGPGELRMYAIVPVLSSPTTEVPTAQVGKQTTLLAGQTYWIGVLFSAVPDVRRGSSATVGWRDTGQVWPTLPDPYEANATENGFEWPLFATIQTIP